MTVLYDRDCALCTWTAGQLRRADRRGRLALLPLQDAARSSDPRVARAARTHALPESVHAVSADGSVAAGPEAVLRILRALPGGALLTLWARLPGARRLLHATYAAVARNRGRIGALVVGQGQQCEVLPETLASVADKEAA